MEWSSFLQLVIMTILIGGLVANLIEKWKK